jgi:hypothetical protein
MSKVTKPWATVGRGVAITGHYPASLRRAAEHRVRGIRELVGDD